MRVLSNMRDRLPWLKASSRSHFLLSLQFSTLQSKRKIEQKNQTVKKLKFPQINRAPAPLMLCHLSIELFFLSGSPVLTWSYALGFQLLGRSLGAKVSSLFSLKPKIHEHYDLCFDFYYFYERSELQ